MRLRTLARCVAGGAAALLLLSSVATAASADTEPTGTAPTGGSTPASGPSTNATTPVTTTPVTTAPTAPTTPPTPPTTAAPTTGTPTPTSASPTPTPTTAPVPTPTATATTPTATATTPTTTPTPAQRNQSTATPVPGPSAQAATPADDPITARWNALGGAAGLLGEPVGARQAVSGGERQAYQRGSIWWSPGTGAWETHDAIGTRYQQLGESTSSLGFPTSGEVAVAGGVRQSYAGGAIWWSGRSGAWETRGAVGLRFLAIGDVTSWLGFPVGPEVGAADGVRQTFLGGNIWWSNHSGGAWETHGAINDDYWRGYGPQGWYGFPTSAEYGYYGGMRQDFEHGSLLWSVQAVADATFSGVSARDVWASWRPGCPVGPESLTLVRVNYWGFDNTVHRGEIVVRSDLAGRVASVLGSALADHYPIRQMWRVDYFRGDDPASMAADNTSGFNCRQVTGGTGLSPHSYGIAVDIDTVENPYYAGGRWWPNTDYVDRNNVRWGMLFSGSLVTRAFAAQGYAWGGSYLDYQHFEFVG